MKKAIATLFLFMAGVGFSVLGAEPAELEPPFRIRGTAPGNWWTMGQEVRFLPFPKDTTAKNIAERREAARNASAPRPAMPSDWRGKLVGRVMDSEGRRLVETAIPLNEFFRDGWRFVPGTPGFYQVEFSLRTDDGKEIVLVESHNSRPGWRKSGVPAITVHRRGHDFAVAGRAPNSADDNEMFGVCLRESHGERYHFLPALNFNFARLHWIPWHFIEKEKGTFSWESWDAAIAELQAAGIAEFVGNFWGVPRWASQNPDAPGTSIWSDWPHSYPPADWRDLENFLTALVTRYPMIDTWEVGNEPHFPGQSIFWRGTPGEYAQMLKTSAATIRRLRPDATIWLGGIGNRYVEFYRELVSKYRIQNDFDVLPLHGRDINTRIFMDMNRHFGFEKPVVQGEWHAILQKSGDKKLLSEEELSYRMIMDLLLAIHRGAEKISVWNWAQGTEREFLEHYRLHGETVVSCGGFFRESPYGQPRLPMLVLRNFMDHFFGRVKVGDCFAFGGGANHIAILESRAGPGAVIWTEIDKPAAIAPEIRALLNGGASLRDWEGREVAVDGDFGLRPGQVYFLSGLVLPDAAAWRGARAELPGDRRDAMALSLEHIGEYQNGPLLDDDLKLIGEDGDKTNWLPLGNFVPLSDEMPGHPGFAARFAAALTVRGMELVVDVHDSRWTQEYPPQAMWNGDSVQFAIDTVGRGRVEDRLEFVALRTREGKPLFWRQFAPSLAGELPALYATPPSEGVDSRIAVTDTPDGKGLRYALRVGHADLYPWTPSPGAPVRFSILVNDNQGEGRRGFLEWASGIGSKKCPADYGTLVARGSAETVCRAEDFYRRVNSERSEFTDGVYRAETADATGDARMIGAPFAASPGVPYHYRFRARGNAPLHFILQQEDAVTRKWTRRDLMTRIRLDPDEWREFDGRFLFPDTASKGYLFFLSWRAKGWFEIKDFQAWKGGASF